MLQARIPPGRHEIVLRYWPSTFTGGLLIAVGGVLFLIGFVVVTLRRNSRRAEDIRHPTSAMSGADPPV
jgi:uncharacterized membrane protein YfhO